jgi:small subunit ribosomal protein S21
MFIIKISENQNIDKALKILKGKVIRSKQNEKLKERQEYVKKSVKRRNDLLNAKYKQKFKDSQ